MKFQLLLLCIVHYFGYAAALRTQAVCDGGELKVYADGVLVGTHDSSASPVGSFTIPDNAEVLGLECATSAGLGGMMAEVDNDYLTDSTWHCSNRIQAGWSTLSFDASSWQMATVVAEITGSQFVQRAGVGSDVKWIWTSAYQNGDWRVFCRGLLKDHGAPDNAGRNFILAFMTNINYPSSAALLDTELYISTSSSARVSVRVSTPGVPSALSHSFTITGGEVEQITVPSQLMLGLSEYAQKAIQISATGEVVAYGVNKQSYSNDAFLALPNDALGTEYYTVTWSSPENPDQIIAMVGVEDNTQVSITFRSDMSGSVNTSSGTFTAGRTLTVTLDKYDTYSISSTADLTGTHIVSQRDIVVYSGDKKASVTWPYASRSADHLVEQLPSVDKWGTQFIITPIPLRTTGDEYKIVAANANTEVTIRRGSTVIEQFMISSAGGHHLFHANSSLVALLLASGPVLVVQFEQSIISGREARGDPSMQIIPPVYLFTPDISFATPQSATSSYLNYVSLIIKESDRNGLRYNDEPIPSSIFSTIPGSQEYIGESFISAIFDIPSEGTHRINHIRPGASFGAIIYGFGDRETYATTAGYRLTSINQVCSQTAGSPGDGIDNDCDGAIDEDDCSAASGADCAQRLPIHGGWAAWSVWSACAQCGTASTRTRSRTCTNPTPQYNGLACSTADEGSTQTEACNVACVSVDGGYTEWSDWSECDSVSCQRERVRTCNSPVPQYEGADCAGDRREALDCPDCDFCLVSERTQCSDTTSQEMCEYLGCCWVAGASPACAHSSEPPAVLDDSVSCGAPVANRVECGHMGIGREDCLGYGCCWYTQDDGPWCYRTTEPVEVEDGETVSDCTGIPNGNYQSPTNCREYTVCLNSQSLVASCPLGQYWDDSQEACSTSTSTCNDICTASACQNGGGCDYDGDGYVCVCTEGLNGDHCEFQDVCLEAPCLNNATCSPVENAFTCSCVVGYLGDTCEFEDACQSAPCQNDGVCSPESDTFSCECAEGFSGETCEEEDGGNRGDTAHQRSDNASDNPFDPNNSSFLPMVGGIAAGVVAISALGIAAAAHRRRKKKQEEAQQREQDAEAEAANADHWTDTTETLAAEVETINLPPIRRPVAPVTAW